MPTLAERVPLAIDRNRVESAFQPDVQIGFQLLLDEETADGFSA